MKNKNNSMEQTSKFRNSQTDETFSIISSKADRGIKRFGYPGKSRNFINNSSLTSTSYQKHQSFLKKNNQNNQRQSLQSEKIKMDRANSFLMKLTKHIQKQFEQRKSLDKSFYKKVENAKDQQKWIFRWQQDKFLEKKNNVFQIKKKQQNQKQSLNLPILSLNKTNQAYNFIQGHPKSQKESCSNKSNTNYLSEVHKKSSKTTVDQQSRISSSQKKQAKYYLPYIESSRQFIQISKVNIQFKAQNIQQPRDITAKSYLIINRHTLNVLANKNSQNMIEIASLSKIMTCYLTILVCKKYDVNSSKQFVKVSQKASNTIGTSAFLQRGDLVSIYDLLYALMLPSGNDASIALAEGIGKIILRNQIKEHKKTPYQIFISHMNLFAKQLQIKQSYQNPSGLQLNPNFSTPKAIAVLTSLAMKDESFYKIVNTRQYQISVKNEWSGLTRKLAWKNTNKLLWQQGWCGVKTGTTEAAGNCLMACYKDWLFGVYGCETLKKRFTECLKLCQILKKQGKLS